MKRKALEKMKIWLNTGDKRVLWIFGAPQTGKTYLVLQFAKECFEGFIYLNLADDAALREDIARFLENQDRELIGYSGDGEQDRSGSLVGEVQSFTGFLANRFGLPEDIGKSFVFILDELEAFDEQEKLMHVIHQNSSVPFIIVSNKKPVDCDAFYCVQLFPMTYDEFLIASGKEWYEEVIRGHFQNFKKVPSLIHEELLSLFEEYLLTGGMPGAVEEYLKGDEHKEFIPSIHRKTLGAIKNCFEAEQESNKMNRLFDSIPDILLKENRQFRFNQIRKGLTYKDFEVSLKSLTDAGILYKAKKLDDKENSFVLYYPDHGLLNTVINAKIPVRQIYDPVKMQEMNPLGDILLKNYFAMCSTAGGKDLYYWNSGSSAKVEFVEKEPSNNRLIPYEVDLNKNNRSRSMGVFIKEFKVDEAVYFNNNNFSIEEQNGVSIINIPYYAIHCI